MPYTILTYCHCMCHNNPLSYIYTDIGEGMQGVGESFKLPKGKGRVILKFWRIFIVFTAPELYPFLPAFFLFSNNPGNNVKTKNYKKIFKVLTLSTTTLTKKFRARLWPF